MVRCLSLARGLKLIVYQPGRLFPLNQLSPPNKILDPADLRDGRENMKADFKNLTGFIGIAARILGIFVQPILTFKAVAELVQQRMIAQAEEDERLDRLRNPANYRVQNN